MKQRWRWDEALERLDSTRCSAVCSGASGEDELSENNEEVEAEILDPREKLLPPVVRRNVAKRLNDGLPHLLHCELARTSAEHESARRGRQ